MDELSGESIFGDDPEVSSKIIWLGLVSWSENLESSRRCGVNLERSALTLVSGKLPTGGRFELLELCGYSLSTHFGFFLAQVVW